MKSYRGLLTDRIPQIVVMRGIDVAGGLLESGRLKVVVTVNIGDSLSQRLVEILENAIISGTRSSQVVVDLGALKRLS